jgi:hypothetical protein
MGQLLLPNDRLPVTDTKRLLQSPCFICQSYHLLEKEMVVHDAHRSGKLCLCVSSYPEYLGYSSSLVIILLLVCTSQQTRRAIA